MYISLNWVKQHCPFETADGPQRIGERFSLHTAEVEGVVARGESLHEFIAAKVLDVKKVAGADRLTECRVDTGAGEVTVVCGAPNVRAGMLAPLARPGTVVNGMTIRKAKIRGVASEGMLCAADEVGLSEDHAGLVELPVDAKPGTPLDRVLEGVRDVVLEVDNKSLTHRPDLWGHHGIAREFAAIYGAEMRPYPIDESLASRPGDVEVTVRIEEGEARRRCRRYCGLRIDGITVGPSPEWLARQLHAVGSRPINNIVDVTNYILFDLGQPLHAFDREKIGGGEVIVRMPRDGEKLTLLDGREVELDPEDLVISDASRPTALAGVMGGEDSEITDATTSIFLESANFEPTSVRRSSTRHGRTESSARFEKSLDPEGARLGILRAAALILELCPGARVVGPLADVGFTPPQPTTIELSSGFIARRLGADLPPGRSKEILESLGFLVEETASDAAAIGIGEATWRVTVPSWRATRDVSIREDLVEEVGRIHGYGQIVPFAPAWPVTAPAGNPRRALERRVKTYLTQGCGLNEVLTYSMVGAAHCEQFGLDPALHLKLRNPTSEELDRMRREIVPIHLEKARDNQRFLDRFGFFELGRVYLKDAGRAREPSLPRESTRVAGVVAFPDKSESNFYAVRDVVMSLLEALRVDDAAVVPLRDPPGWAHPGVGASVTVGGAPAGSFYRIHPDVVDRLELRGDVLAFDLDFDALEAAPTREVKYRALPRFPSVPFDVAVLAPERTPVGDILAVARKAGGALLESAAVFDVYRGKGVGEGEKSVALQVEFRAADRTLGAEEIETLQKKLIEGLERAGFALRR